MTCGPCLDGRHVRCRRDGCTCTVCVRRSPSAPPRVKRAITTSEPPRRARVAPRRPARPRCVLDDNRNLPDLVLALLQRIYAELKTSTTPLADRPAGGDAVYYSAHCRQPKEPLSMHSDFGKASA